MNSVLNVRFYQKQLQNDFESQVQGRPIHYMADFVKIETPGNMLSIIDTLVNQDHKDRFPLEWARFLNDKAEGKHADMPPGTLLTDWPLLNAAQAVEMKHYKFYTVEQVAGASDAQLGTIGMVAGMSPFSLRDKAKAFLAIAKDSAGAMAAVDELQKRDVQIAELQDAIKRQEELVASLMSDKPKPGRPKKEAAEA